MDLMLSPELLRWIDANRGHRSRQAYIAKCLREYMADFNTTEKDTTKKHDEIHYTNATKGYGL